MAEIERNIHPDRGVERPRFGSHLWLSGRRGASDLRRDLSAEEDPPYPRPPQASRDSCRRGLSRSTGKPGVLLVTSGPGATNAVTGITDALLDSIPMVVITGQVATHLIGSDAFSGSGYGEHHAPLH